MVPFRRASPLLRAKIAHVCDLIAPRHLKQQQLLAFSQVTSLPLFSLIHQIKLNHIHERFLFRRGPRHVCSLALSQTRSSLGLNDTAMTSRQTCVAFSQFRNVQILCKSCAGSTSPKLERVWDKTPDFRHDAEKGSPRTRQMSPCQVRGLPRTTFVCLMEPPPTAFVFLGRHPGAF